MRQNSAWQSSKYTKEYSHSSLVFPSATIQQFTLIFIPIRIMLKQFSSTWSSFWLLTKVVMQQIVFFSSNAIWHTSFPYFSVVDQFFQPANLLILYLVSFVVSLFHCICPDCTNHFRCVLSTRLVLLFFSICLFGCSLYWYYPTLHVTPPIFNWNISAKNHRVNMKMVLVILKFYPASVLRFLCRILYFDWNLLRCHRPIFTFAYYAS